MSQIEVKTVDDQLVVDSRLVADELGIQHSDWMSNVVKKYQQIVEESFGTLRFENGASTMPNGRINPTPVRFAYLTEDQATFLMTLSRNTPEVVKCKANLVKAFSQAKKQLQSNESSLLGKTNIAEMDEYELLYYHTGLLLKTKREQKLLAEKQTELAVRQEVHEDFTKELAMTVLDQGSDIHRLQEITLENKPLAVRDLRVGNYRKWTDVIKQRLIDQDRYYDYGNLKKDGTPKVKKSVGFIISDLTRQINKTLFGVENFHNDRDNMTDDQRDLIVAFEHQLVTISDRFPQLSVTQLVSRALQSYQL